MAPEPTDRKLRGRGELRRGAWAALRWGRLSLGGQGWPLCGWPSGPRAWETSKVHPWRRERCPGMEGAAAKAPRRVRLEFLRNQREAWVGHTERGQSGAGPCWAGGPGASARLCGPSPQTGALAELPGKGSCLPSGHRREKPNHGPDVQATGQALRI